MSALVLRNGKVIDVIGKKIDEGDVVIKDGRIAGHSSSEDSTDEIIDVKGAYISPGLIDGHIHIESSMLTPLEFAYEAVKYGTTSVFVDPHEAANVLGRKGIELFLEQSDLVPFSMNIGIPSCVPATSMETSGGAVTTRDIEELLKDERVFGLSEMMNFPGIVFGVGDARKKVELALKAGKIVDGHSPGLSGKDLSLYISNGETDGKVRIGSDHECTTVEEAIEKWEKGMYVMLRHGSAAKDMENILPGLCRSGLDLARFGLVSDDLSANDLRRRGHIDHLVNIAAEIIRKEKGISLEKAVIEAISMATLNHAEYFNKNTGKIIDGAAADLMIFDSLEEVIPHTVISKGSIIVAEGVYVGSRHEYDYKSYSHPVNIPEDLPHRVKVASENNTEKIRVIGVKPDTLFTEEILAQIPVNEGVVTPDAGTGIVKVAVIERHRGTGNVSVGYVKGFELTSGAIASTVAHDSHNIIAIGTDDVSLVRAVEKIKEMGGGLAAVFGDCGEVLPLALCGLMSTEDIDTVLGRHEKLSAFLKKMGFSKDPFLPLSFIALPVIPKLKITDEGLVDVDKFDFVDLLVEHS